MEVKLDEIESFLTEIEVALNNPGARLPVFQEKGLCIKQPKVELQISSSSKLSGLDATLDCLTKKIEEKRLQGLISSRKGLLYSKGKRNSQRVLQDHPVNVNLSSPSNCLKQTYSLLKFCESFTQLRSSSKSAHKTLNGRNKIAEQYFNLSAKGRCKIELQRRGTCTKVTRTLQSEETLKDNVASTLRPKRLVLSEPQFKSNTFSKKPSHLDAHLVKAPSCPALCAEKPLSRLLIAASIKENYSSGNSKQSGICNESQLFSSKMLCKHQDRAMTTATTPDIGLSLDNGRTPLVKARSEKYLCPKQPTTTQRIAEKEVISNIAPLIDHKISNTSLPKGYLYNTGLANTSSKEVASRSNWELGRMSGLNKDTSSSMSVKDYKQALKALHARLHEDWV